VEGCSNAPTDVFRVDSLHFEYLVCGFHLQALGEGEPWEEAPDGRARILMGEDIAPDFVGGGWRTVVGSSGHRHTINVRVGRDGVETESVRFAISSEDARAFAETLLQLAGNQ
jgi:hypothetical protein